MGEQGSDMSHVAHNSFIQCFMDMGILGGTLFLGAFYCAIAVCGELGVVGCRGQSGDVARFAAYVLRLSLERRCACSR